MSVIALFMSEPKARGPLSKVNMQSVLIFANSRGFLV